MEISLLGYVKARLSSIGHSGLEDVANECGVPLSTLRKIHYGEVGNPRIKTVQALYDYLRRAEKQAA